MPETSHIDWIPPMKATSSKTVPTSTGWAAELKWDGMRIMASVTPESVSLWSSNGRDKSTSFPELAELADELGTTAVLDGEIVVFDGDRPSFADLQHRIHVDQPTNKLMTDYPIVFIVFDLLSLEDRSLLSLPYEQRRRLLTELLPEHPRWKSPPYLEDDAQRLLDLADERDLEGIVVKRLDSTYEPGSRSPNWIKLKIRRRQEFVVGGWLEGQGELDKSLGSLIVGVWDGDDLVMAGRVGSGLTGLERSRLQKMLTVQPTSPFSEMTPLDKVPHWVEPLVVVEVEFSEWTADKGLRHPTYCGIRTDRDPNDVVRELWTSTTASHSTSDRSGTISQSPGENSSNRRPPGAANGSSSDE